jgi:septum formation protein
MKLILASGSEWRKRLLALLDVSFGVRESGVDEEGYLIDEPDELVGTLSAAKAEAVVGQLEEERVFGSDDGGYVVVGADTMIVAEGEIIGKPEHRTHAKEIIGKLAGKTHEIWTGVCVMNDLGEKRVEVEKSTVRFLTMSEEQIERYLDSKEWEGKAGGYQLQGAIEPYVAEVEGSTTNVIGLPMVTLVDMLEEVGVVIEVNVRRVLEENLGCTS